MEIQSNDKYISKKRNDMLKLIAMITMFIDHLGHMDIIKDIYWNKVSRTIGRIAFPIFAYQVAIGYSKTKNLKNYIKRLFIFALLSHIPYIIFNSDNSIHPFHFNVIYLLLLGVFSIHFYEKAKEYWNKNKILSMLFFIVMVALIIFPDALYVILHRKYPNPEISTLFTILNTQFTISYDYYFSYGTYGVLLVLFFHLFKGKPIRLAIGYTLLAVVQVWLTMSKNLYLNSLRWFGENYTYFQSFFQVDKFSELSKYQNSLKTLSIFWFQCRSIITLPFIIGLERFFIKVKLNKFIGYSFYPLHMLVIYSIHIFITLK